MSTMETAVKKPEPAQRSILPPRGKIVFGNDDPYKGYKIQKRWREEAFVTPEDATWLLENKFALNRNARESDIASLKRDMLSGHYRPNGQGIIVLNRKSTPIINGFHRLTAISRLKGKITAVPLEFFYGYEDANHTCDTIDIHKPRNTKDIINTRDRHFQYVTAKHVTCLKGMYYGNKYQNHKAKGGPGQIRYKSSETDWVNRYIEHEDAIRFAVDVMGRSRTLACKNVTSAIARAYYHIDKSDLELFCETLRYEQSLDKSEKMTIPAVLRDYLLQLAEEKDCRIGWRVVYWKITHCLYKYKCLIEGKYYNKNKIQNMLEHGCQIFTLPGEKPEDVDGEYTGK